MSVMELGIIVPNTVEELEEYWGRPHVLELVGDIKGRLRKKERDARLTSWGVWALPITVEWVADSACTVRGIRYDDGPLVRLDGGAFQMLADDKLVLTVRP